MVDQKKKKLSGKCLQLGLTKNTKQYKNISDGGNWQMIPRGFGKKK